jgi:hypothetical protein
MIGDITGNADKDAKSGKVMDCFKFTVALDDRMNIAM